MTQASPVPPAPGDGDISFPSDTVLARLMDLHPKLIDLSLDRTLDLLERLGRPQDRLPPVVHVAGTNGKGSAIAALRAIAEAAGYRVHVYTSPHLARFHERIRLAGKLIEEPALLALLEHCEAVNENRPITFFEITTCAALKAFSDTPADLLLLETGMGGRLDSTNVVARPAATLITPVSMDHMQFLGDTIEKIAGEKAAIQKPGTPSVVGPQDPAAMAVISAYAEKTGAPLARYGAEWSAAPAPGGGIAFASAAWSGTLPAPNLAGAHQQANIANAVATALVLRDQGFDIPDVALESGVQRIDWPARLQPLTRGPIAESLPGWEVILDGGHNAAAGEALAAELARRAQADGRPVTAVCGMMNTKAATDFLRPLAPHLTRFRAIAIPGEENSFSADDLAAMARAAGISDTAPATDIAAAIAPLPKSGETGRLILCGSLYLAGRILRANG
jgi:dihydrofolate synthase/folylpolyglutamate synthase